MGWLMLFLGIILMAVPVVVLGATGGFDGASGVSLMMGYGLFNVPKPEGQNPGAGGGIKTEIYICLEDDVDTFPTRGSDLITISSDILMKAGKYWHLLYGTDKTIEPSEKKLPGPNEDSGGWELTLKLFHPGIYAKIQEFKAKHAFERFYIIIRNCQTNTMFLIGEPCNPVSMNAVETKWGKTMAEGKGNDFTFISQQSLPMAIYSGTVTLDESSDSGS